MGIISNLWQGSKAHVQAFGMRVKALKVSFTNFQTALSNLQAAVQAFSKVSKQVETEVNKVTFRNQPHLERIAEAKKRIDQNMTKINTLLQNPMKRH
ncbi:hypothetical protein [Weissella halotolerans]|uniref:Uncharacterized protein n=1 Tax=Weissella halotolerans DSM 20190 TaxID=1123500 RepID=A0A0R2G8E9_9LACO|nr:hypothetical protein [Weissella halotolerans]KRN33564.1 hypothetical protein IV68_GL000370 [Weissella halotolerans DSM 20190]